MCFVRDGWYSQWLTTEIFQPTVNHPSVTTKKEGWVGRPLVGDSKLKDSGLTKPKGVAARHVRLESRKHQNRRDGRRPLKCAKAGESMIFPHV